MTYILENKYLTLYFIPNTIVIADTGSMKWILITSNLNDDMWLSQEEHE